MQSFRDLNCWKEAREFRNKIFELIKTFPLEEKYRLVDQIIRSSRGMGDFITRKMLNIAAFTWVIGGVFRSSHYRIGLCVY
ncbi:MAG: four helix bundle protein [Owenweeksia sp.]|nr:four helix bundle protein [Owenweeksia sp.]